MKSNHIISQNLTILEALERLDILYDQVKVLFAVDDDEKMTGTITDGDIRRALIKGVQLKDTVKSVIHTNFSFVNSDEEDVVSKLRSIRDKKIMLVPVLDSSSRILRILNLNETKSLLPVDVVMMAGGKGERLRPLTAKVPKPLLPVGDKAIIDHNVDRLISYGISNISVTVNYLKEQIQEHYKSPRNGVQIKCICEPQFLGTIGSIQYAKPFVNDTVLVMNSDLFTNINYEDFYLHFKEHGADMSIAAIPYSVSVPYAILDSDDDCVRNLVEKPIYNYYANAGIYLIKKELIDLLPENGHYDATDLIKLLLSKHKKVVRFPLSGSWMDIGNLQEYQKAQELVKHMW